jgi:hypothetical protein
LAIIIIAAIGLGIGAAYFLKRPKTFREALADSLGISADELNVNFPLRSAGIPAPNYCGEIMDRSSRLLTRKDLTLHMELLWPPISPHD